MYEIHKSKKCIACGKNKVFIRTEDPRVDKTVCNNSKCNIDIFFIERINKAKKILNEFKDYDFII